MHLKKRRMHPRYVTAALLPEKRVAYPLEIRKYAIYISLASTFANCSVARVCGETSFICDTDATISAITLQITDYNVTAYHVIVDTFIYRRVKIATYTSISENTAKSRPSNKNALSLIEEAGNWRNMCHLGNVHKWCQL